MRSFFLMAMGLVIAAHLAGETIAGSILIERKLTKRSITPAVAIYDRGSTVELGRNPEEDPLAFERSHVAVWIEGLGPADRQTASMEQVGRRFSPDLVVVSVGESVLFPNMDPIFHNVFSLSSTRIFDLGNYPKGDSRSVTFSRPGIVYVNCHLHPNMAGTIVVTPNAWHAKADRAGQFELRDVPPGDYKIVAWHKSAGYFRKTVRVVPGADTRTEFFIPFTEAGTGNGQPGR
jgi:plastocyanin